MLRITTKTTNYELTDAIDEILRKRLEPVERLITDQEADVLCEVELSKITEHHQNGRVFRAEVNLSYKGILIRAEALEESMENAIDAMKENLKTELRKRAERSESLFKRGARRAKELLRFGR